MSVLVPIYHVPESLAAASPPPAFLALASRVSADVASLVPNFLVLVELGPMFPAIPPAPHSSRVSPTLVSPALVSPAPVSPALVSPAPVSPAQARTGKN